MQPQSTPGSVSVNTRTARGVVKKPNNPFTGPETATYEHLQAQFAGDVRTALSSVQGEIAERNETINKNDGYIYGNMMEHSLDIPIGHDFTPFNWLRRAVEIHRSEFMGKPFTVTSTYDAVDTTSAATDPQTGQPDPADVARIDLENRKRKDDAEQRRTLVDGIIRDNGGHAMWANMGENGSAVGFSVLKAWMDEDTGKYILQNVEAVENCYAIWDSDDYRTQSAFAYVYQLLPERAMQLYDIPETTPTSPAGEPLSLIGQNNYQGYLNGEQMVTIMEITGTIPRWKSNNGTLERCNLGDETPMNALIVGNTVEQIIDEPKKMPKYYILQNKVQRRRPWGVPDISDAAIDINLSFIETFSDWRTLSSKVNFPKWKAFGFPTGTQIPKPSPRKIEALPLAEGQDLQPLSYGNAIAGQQDFEKQIEELKEDFVRETGISRNLFDMPDAVSDNNSSMLTAMKSISDTVENKKQLWTPVIVRIFNDAIETIGEYDDAIKQLNDKTENWYFRVNWPSMMSKDDPSYQANLLNRFNAGTMSIGSFLEHQGESREEIDRIRDEMDDNLTAAIHGRMLGEIAQLKIMPFNPQRNIKQTINWKGDLTPQQAGNIAQDNSWQDGPYGDSIGPQGNAGQAANDNLINNGFVNGNPYSGGTPIDKTAKGGNAPTTPAQQPGQPQPNQPGGAPGQQPEMIAPGGAPGAQPVSQPGSGAPATTAAGKNNQRNQRKGK